MIYLNEDQINSIFSKFSYCHILISCIYRIKDFLFLILTLLTHRKYLVSPDGEPGWRAWYFTVIKTVTETKSPLFFLSVISKNLRITQRITIKIVNYLSRRWMTADYTLCHELYDVTLIFCQYSKHGVLSFLCGIAGKRKNSWNRFIDIAKIQVGFLLNRSIRSHIFTSIVVPFHDHEPCIVALFWIYNIMRISY